MTNEIKHVRLGLILAFVTILFGIAMGIGFGIAEDGFKDWIAQGISAHPTLHDAKSQEKIWRYAQRAHFHATGVGAFTLGMILLVAFSSLKPALKKLTSVLIGLGGLYSLSWLTMFLLGPALGREAAHHALLTEAITYIAVGSLLVGIGLLVANLLTQFGSDEPRVLLENRSAAGSAPAVLK